jgi:hypothetical protein
VYGDFFIHHFTSIIACILRVAAWKSFTCGTGPENSRSSEWDIQFRNPKSSKTREKLHFAGHTIGAEDEKWDAIRAAGTGMLRFRLYGYPPAIGI